MKALEKWDLKNTRYLGRESKSKDIIHGLFFSLSLKKNYKKYNKRIECNMVVVAESNRFIDDGVNGWDETIK